jgi:hypothetical protein
MLSPRQIFENNAIGYVCFCLNELVQARITDMNTVAFSTESEAE